MRSWSSSEGFNITILACVCSLYLGWWVVNWIIIEYRNMFFVMSLGSLHLKNFMSLLKRFMLVLSPYLCHQVHSGKGAQQAKLQKHRLCVDKERLLSCATTRTNGEWHEPVPMSRSWQSGTKPDHRHSSFQRQRGYLKGLHVLSSQLERGEQRAKEHTHLEPSL